MKKILVVLLSIAFLAPASAITVKEQKNEHNLDLKLTKNLPQYFRDIAPQSKLNIVLDSAISREILEPGSFFRPEADLPAILFLRALVKDSETKLKSNNFADILSAAVKNEIIDEKTAKNLQFDSPVNKLRTLKGILKSKKLYPARRISQKFREIFSSNLVSPKDLPYLEAAVASGILLPEELKNFQPNQFVTRREFFTWLYNYERQGERKVKLATDLGFERNKKTFRYNSQGRSRLIIERKNSQLKKIREKRKKLEKQNSSLSSLSKISRKIVKNSFPGESVLNEIYNEIIEKYRFADELTQDKKQEMVDQSLSALVQALGDKYSFYIKPQKTKQYLDNLKGEFEGIGAYVEMIDGKFTIIAPLKGSPAAKAGLKAQDIVLEVNNKDVSGMSISETVDLIMGPAGTTVNLKISRGTKTLNVSVIRDRIIEPNVVLKWEQGIPIVEIHQFNPDTILDLNKILPEILAKNPRGLILDLRNNPGGYLSSAQEVGSLFLNKGEVVFYTEDRHETKTFSAKTRGALAKFDNIVVLENKGTASAAEILITTLQDYGKARVVGTTSLGKGTVQNVHDLQNGGLLKLTIAKWLTPQKRWINEVGIAPDLKVEESSERFGKEDKQLQAALREIFR